MKTIRAIRTNPPITEPAIIPAKLDDSEFSSLSLSSSLRLARVTFTLGTSYAIILVVV